MQTKLLSGNKQHNRAADTQQTLAVRLRFFFLKLCTYRMCIKSEVFWFPLQPEVVLAHLQPRLGGCVSSGAGTRCSSHRGLGRKQHFLFLTAARSTSFPNGEFPFCI